MAGSDDLKELQFRWRAFRELIGREMEAFDRALSAALQEPSRSVEQAPPPDSTAPDRSATVPLPPAALETPEGTSEPVQPPTGTTTVRQDTPYAPPYEMDRIQYVLWVVANFPEQDQGEMARRMFGENTRENRKQVSNILGELQRDGKILNDGYGRWRIRQPGERKKRKR